MGRPEEATLTLPANLKYAAALGATLTALLEDVTDEAYNLQMAVHELFTNIVEHGYGHAADNQLHIQLVLDVAQDCFTAVLQDTAPPFSPELIGWEQPEKHWETAVTPQGNRYTLTSAPEPDLLQIRGRGFFLISQLMSHVVCHAKAEGNEWTVSKSL